MSPRPYNMIRIAFWAILVGLASPSTALSASYDPELTWRTITTEHFHIHFHQSEEQLADEFSTTVESVYDTMTEELRWIPARKTHVVLVDRTDSANGYAQVLPWNTIVIYVTAPQEDSTLNFYDDWFHTIATHELTHILHMDTHHGVVSLARRVVGRIASTNMLSPGWIIEGFATYQETKHTSGGRGRAPSADMIKRTAVLEDDFPPLGNMDGFQPNPPRGNLRYLFGQDFIQYVADQYGEDLWTDWIHTYGASLPYILPAKRVFGKSFVRLYKEWRAASFEKYSQQQTEIEQHKVTESQQLSDPTADCRSPSFSPDGTKLVWSCYNLKTGSNIWMADGDGENEEVLLKRRSAKEFTWRVDSKAFVYAGTHIVNRFNIWSDIFMHTLGKKKPTVLTQGARARDPDFSPDGSRLLVVTNRAQNNQLQTMTVDKRLEALTDLTDHTQFSTPRYSPNGESIAVSVWSDGQRDLWLYNPDGTPLRQLTDDLATDRDPTWSEDGRWLYFCSDRTGVANIYRIDTDSEEIWQVTNVLTGAAKPSLHPDGEKLAFQQYSKDGWEIRLVHLDTLDPIPHGYILQEQGAPKLSTVLATLTIGTHETALLWEGSPLKKAVAGVPHDPFPFPSQSPGETLDTFDQSVVKGVFGEEQDYPFTIEPHRYNPFPSLLPSYIVPLIQTTPYPSGKNFQGLPFALHGTLATGSTDTLRHYGWSANLSYRTDAEFLGWGASFTLNRFIPVFTIGAYSNAVSTGLIPIAPDLSTTTDLNAIPTDGDDYYWEKRTHAYFTVSYPYTSKTSIFFRYRFTHRVELQPLPDNAWMPGIPSRGTIGALSAGWRYAWSEPTPRAISTENGRIFSFVGSFISPWLGTSLRGIDNIPQPLTQLQLAAELREYIVNPWVPNHVLAFRAGAGLAIGDNQFLGNYKLGGSFGESAFSITPDEFRMVRGYSYGHDVGDMYWVSSMEYRLPLWHIQRGLGTLPAYLRTLSGAVFVDAGNAFGELKTAEDPFRGTLVGVGAELQLRAVLSYGLGFSGRLGYAVGLTENGYGPLDPNTVYFQLGGSF